MDYSFNVQAARLYGVDEAVFIQNLYWWTRKNRANGKHLHDGRYWSYNTIKAFTELFPFWGESQIRRIVKKLQAAGAIHVGNYNASRCDRTQWYALDESVLSIYENRQLHVTEAADGSGETGAPIPDGKPSDSKPSDSKLSDGKPDLSADACCGGCARPRRTPGPHGDSQVCALAEHYRQNGGVANKDVLDSIRFYLRQGMTPQVLHEAIRKGGLAGKPWPYIDGILRNWDGAGVHTPSQLQNLTQARLKSLEGFGAESSGRGAGPPARTCNPFLQMLQEGAP